jgi:hypothetical protein
MHAISKILDKVDTKYGAPMGRANIGSQPHTITSGRSCRIFKSHQVKVYDRKVTLCDGYDKGGVYWGIGGELRVRYTKDLSYVEFYRL